MELIDWPPGVCWLPLRISISAAPEPEPPGGGAPPGGGESHPRSVEDADTVRLGLVRDGVIPLERAFALLAENPARILGIPGGRLETGADADIALIEPDAPWIVDSRRMAAAAGNTPFDRQPVQGKVINLFKAGVPLLRPFPDGE